MVWHHGVVHKNLRGPSLIPDLYIWPPQNPSISSCYLREQYGHILVIKRSEDNILTITSNWCNRRFEFEVEAEIQEWLVRGNSLYKKKTESLVRYFRLYLWLPSEQTLTFSQHIQETAVKFMAARSALRPLLCGRSYLSLKLKVLLHTFFQLPIWTYWALSC